MRFHATFASFMIACLLITGCSQTPPRPLPSPTATPNMSMVSQKQIKLGTFSTSPQPSAQSTGSPPPQSNPPDPCHTDQGIAPEAGCVCHAWLITCDWQSCDVAPNVWCRNGQTLACVNSVPGSPEIPEQPCNPFINNWCGGPMAPEPGTYCIAKPVIYLYPEYSTMVDVKVQTPGKVVVSDPLYGPNGWQQVIAQPNGDLLYQGKSYSSLFYETSVDTVYPPQKGLTIAHSHLEPMLRMLTAQLGLKGREQDEFMAYWLPTLRAQNTPYFFFSVIDPIEKHRIDKVVITPKPTTEIMFLAYFKPIDTPYTGPQLVLPKTPKREGFTMVEWGGTLEQTGTIK